MLSEIRKPEYRDVRGISIMRILHPLQDLCTRVLIRTPINSRQLTVVWVLLSLASYGISAVGRPETFVLGAAVLYVAIVLDLCDGEVGRYRARSMSREEDFRTFVRGMYLDRSSHMALTPVWPLAVAWGLYVMTDQSVVFLAGLALGAYHTVCRARPQIHAYMREFFRPRIAQLDDQYVAARQFVGEQSRERWFSRLAAKVELWVRNGKRFNCMILIGGLADWLGPDVLGNNASPGVLFWLFMLWGASAAVLLVWAIGEPLWSKRLEAEIIKGASDN